MIPNYSIFVTNVFNFKIICVLIILEFFFPSKVPTFNIRGAMPWRDPVGDIWRPYDTVKYFKASLTGPGNLWEWDSDGSQWVHSNFIICVAPEVKTHFVTNFSTPKGELPITVYPYINGSARFVSMQDDCVTQPRTNYL